MLNERRSLIRSAVRLGDFRPYRIARCRDEQQTRAALLRLSLLRNDVVVRANGAGAAKDDGGAGVKPSRISSMDVSMSTLGERKPLS